MKKLLLLLFALQGLLMAASLNEITIKDSKVPVVFEQGNFVSLEGKYFVKTPTGNTINFDASEVYEVNNGKIKNIRIYYDAEEFRNEFGKN